MGHPHLPQGGLENSHQGSDDLAVPVDGDDLVLFELVEEVSDLHEHLVVPVVLTHRHPGGGC